MDRLIALLCAGGDHVIIDVRTLSADTVTYDFIPKVVIFCGGYSTYYSFSGAVAQGTTNGICRISTTTGAMLHNVSLINNVLTAPGELNAYLNSATIVALG